LAHLKLVAGTAVSNPQQLRTFPPAVRPRATDSDEGVAQARAVIEGLRPGLDGLSVTELLREINQEKPDNVEFIPYIQRKGDIRTALLKLGIHCQSAMPDDELDVTLYGLVVDPRRLLKFCPELKPFKAILEGITV